LEGSELNCRHCIVGEPSDQLRSRAGHDYPRRLPHRVRIAAANTHNSHAIGPSFRAKDILTDSKIQASPSLPMHSYRDAFGNQCTRVLAPAGLVGFWDSFDVRDTGLPDEVCDGTNSVMETSVKALKHPEKHEPGCAAGCATVSMGRADQS
jgi:hypothetical protein